MRKEEKDVVQILIKLKFKIEFLLKQNGNNIYITMEAIQKQKCVYCKMNMTIDNFKKKRVDSYQKTCNQCLVNRDASAKKRKKCPHGRQKGQCRDCGGVGICEHNRPRSTCKECCGSQIMASGWCRL